MSTVAAPLPQPGDPPPAAPGAATRFAEHLRAGGWFTAVVTTVVAFFVGGPDGPGTGPTPPPTSHAIWPGTGLEWIFPWVTGDDRSLAAINLQQTLLLTGPLILT